MEQPKTEAPIKVELLPSEIFQLNLCVACRSAYCTEKWANALSKEEQEGTERQLDYLTRLSTKLQSMLKND